MSNNNSTNINTNSITKSMSSTVIYSKDSKHRYLLSKQWDSSLPTVTIIMIKAGLADNVKMDTTTMLCVSNAYDNSFGTINIVNIFSSIQSDTLSSDKINNATIVRCCEESDKIIVAFGKGKDNLERKLDVLKMLETYKEKLICIADSQGRTMFHPLAPQVRAKWILVPFEMSNKE